MKKLYRKSTLINVEKEINYKVHQTIFPFSTNSGRDFLGLKGLTKEDIVKEIITIYYLNI